MLMPTHYVDFAAVPASHAEIDARLNNWARWSYSAPAGNASPMFRLYRSTDAAQQYGQQTGQAVDKIDAAKIQSAVVALPTKHRLALSWAYIKRGNPRKAAQTIGVTMQGLRDLVNDGRQMLVNRGV